MSEDRRKNHTSRCSKPEMHVSVLRVAPDRVIYEARCPECDRAALYDEPRKDQTK